LKHNQKNMVNVISTNFHMSNSLEEHIIKRLTRLTSQSTTKPSGRLASPKCLNTVNNNNNNNNNNNQNQTFLMVPPARSSGSVEAESISGSDLHEDSESNEDLSDEGLDVSQRLVIETSPQLDMNSDEAILGKQLC
jgi:hypothetical protein